MTADRVALAMLAMAETLRTQHPPKLKMAIKCARGALKLELSEDMLAHCNLQLGKLIFYYTDHFEMARRHLEDAYNALAARGDDLYVVKRLESLSLLAELYVHCKLWPMEFIKIAIRKELVPASQHHIYYYKFILYFVEANKIEGDVKAATDACNVALNGIEKSGPETRQKLKHMELYFRISKHLISCQMIRTESDPQELALIGQQIKELESDPTMAHHLKNIKLFYMCTKLSFMLYDGQSRTSRNLLRQIQQEVNTSRDTSQVEGIRWMDDKSMTVLACLMTVVNALLQCSYDRVLKYHIQACKHADDVITKSTWSPQEFGVVRCVNHMKLASIELMALCNVMACRFDFALSNLHEMIIYSHRAGGLALFEQYAPHLQYILGLINCYFRENDDAEKHFVAALKMLENRDANASTLINVSRALNYLNQLKLVEYYDVADKLTASRITNCSWIVKTNVKFINALYFFLNHKDSDCRTMLHEMLDEAKAEDLFRLHSLGILLLSLFCPVDESMLKPTVDWSKRSYDHVVTFWSHNVFARLLVARGQDSNEFIEEGNKSFAAINVDAFRNDVGNSPAVNLMQWFEGEPQAYLPKEDLII